MRTPISVILAAIIAFPAGFIVGHGNGKREASKKAPPVMSRIEDSSQGWVGSLPNGLKVQKAGTSFYLIDDQKRVISNGYHDFIILSNGEIVGVSGAAHYLIKDGKEISRGFHTITPAGSGYDASLGARKFSLDKNGQIMEGSPPYPES